MSLGQNMLITRFLLGSVLSVFDVAGSSISSGNFSPLVASSLLTFAQALRFDDHAVENKNMKASPCDATCPALDASSCRAILQAWPTLEVGPGDANQFEAAVSLVNKRCLGQCYCDLRDFSASDIPQHSNQMGTLVQPSVIEQSDPGALSVSPCAPFLGPQTKAENQLDIPECVSNGNPVLAADPADVQHVRRQQVAVVTRPRVQAEDPQAPPPFRSGGFPIRPRAALGQDTTSGEHIHRDLDALVPDREMACIRMHAAVKSMRDRVRRDCAPNSTSAKNRLLLEAASSSSADAQQTKSKLQTSALLETQSLTETTFGVNMCEGFCRSFVSSSLTQCKIFADECGHCAACSAQVIKKDVGPCENAASKFVWYDRQVKQDCDR